MPNNPYSHLFLPLTVGKVQLRNRIALPAVLTNYARDSKVTPRWHDFLVERARGGTGLLVSEIIAVDPLALSHSAIVAGFDERNDSALAETAKAVHAAGGRIVAQLWHPGRQQLWHPSHSPMGVSDQPDAYSWTVPHVMDEGDLERLGEAYISVAERLARVGFDGIELHGAHGYLLTQLMSPWSNTRTDRYGGTLLNRTRLVADIAGAIRKRCSEDFIVGLKMPADEGVVGGIDPDEAYAITAHLSATGSFDYFAYGQGNFSTSLENHVPDMHFEPGHFLNLHRRMREAANGVAVMALGRIGTPDLAEQVIADGFGDLVAMGRAQVSDAAFANKARSGQVADIRPCVFNNYCWGEVHAGKPLLEFHNPQLATEGEASWQPTPAVKQRRVAVVGAGPAGLEAAWVAAQRGHDVTVYSKGEGPGGKLRLEAALPGHEGLQSVIDFQMHRAAQTNVRFEWGRSIEGADLAKIDAQVLILATGAAQRIPLIPSDGSVRWASIHELADELTQGPLKGGRTAVVFDHDHTAPTYAATLALAAVFERIVLVTPRTHVAQGVNYCSGLGIHRRLNCAEVEIRTACTPVSVSEQSITLSNVFSAKESTVTDVDLFLYSTPRRVNDELEASAIASNLEVHRIGDCMAPRNLMIAMHEGNEVGNTI